MKRVGLTQRQEKEGKDGAYFGVPMESKENKKEQEKGQLRELISLNALFKYQYLNKMMNLGLSHPEY